MAETATRTTPERLTKEEHIRRNQAAIALLESWMREDEEEQRETFEFLRRALDEDRPSYRQLFPEP